MIEINEKEVKEAFEHVFFFRNAQQIVVVTRFEKNIKILPSQRALTLWIKKNFNIFSHIEETGKNRAEQAKAERDYIENLIIDLIIANQFTFLQFERNPFSDTPIIEKNDNILKFIAPRIYLHEFRINDYLLGEKMAAEIVDDYRLHFPEFDEIIDWILACRFTEQRRSSFLYLRINAGFGKSFFAAIFEAIGIGKKIKASQLKDNTASDLSPESFRNVMVTIVDEFTHFSQEMKEMTNYISLSAKFQLAERVPQYAKIFLSAEKSTSFFGDAGVDAQIADRVNVIDLAYEKRKIEDRELYKKVGNAVYLDALKKYVYDRVQNIIADYVTMGRTDADKAAFKVLSKFQNKYKVEATTIEKIRERAIDFFGDFIEWSSDFDEFGKRPRNTYFEQLESVAFIKNENEIVLRDPTKSYEIMLKSSGDQFAKIAKFKQTMLDEIFVSTMDKMVYKCAGKSVRGVLINISTMRNKKNKNNVPLEIVEKDGQKKVYEFDGKNIIGEDGHPLF